MLLASLLDDEEARLCLEEFNDGVRFGLVKSFFVVYGTFCDPSILLCGDGRETGCGHFLGVVGRVVVEADFL